MSNQQTMCPVCGTVCELADTIYVKMAINLAYTCPSCKLRFTIATSANAYEVCNEYKQIIKSGVNNGSAKQ